MKSKFGNYAIPLFLFTSLLFISCGGGGSDVDINVDGGGFPPGHNFPLVINTDFEAEETFSFEAQTENRSRMRLEGVNGDITITGISGADSVMITGTRRVGSDSIEDAEDRLQELEVSVQSLATEIFVETIQPQITGGRRYVVDYTITLPADWGIRVTNFNGTVTLASIGNNVTVNNVNGNVTLTEIVGSALVNLVNGTIESRITLPLNGSIELKTVNGDINLDIPVNTSAGFLAAVSIGTVSTSNLALQNESRSLTRLSGILGSGQGTISLETEAIGNITVAGF